MTKLIVLDATKSNLSSYEENNIKVLLELNKKDENGPKIKVVSANKIIDSKLINKENLDDYVKSIKDKLIELLKENDEINII
jgi:hypothetical protein